MRLGNLAINTVEDFNCSPVAMGFGALVELTKHPLGTTMPPFPFTNEFIANGTQQFSEFSCSWPAIGITRHAGLKLRSLSNVGRGSVEDSLGA